MSEPGLTASGMVVTAKSHPSGDMPSGAGHIWKLSHCLGQAGLYCQQLPLLMCKRVPCFKNSRTCKVVPIRHLLHYLKKVCLIHFKTFKTLQYAYLTPPHHYFHHTTFSICPRLLLASWNLGLEEWWKRPQPKATLKLIRSLNLSSQHNHVPNNTLNYLNSPVCTIDPILGNANLHTDKLCGGSHSNLQTQKKRTAECLYLLILYRLVFHIKP